ncbi:outer membrane beta-barrel protein [Spirosoma fluviale]|uniref:Outer membrane protein beta-barrel domain-containing protein n=1 Tax=Spirosoma fluviale TaxID=1597977 RepID=A0A286GL82_9BACT|nr:outer membrane beta-barrel protein [Spirosoma fluviale]SOD96295.1 Outer membrane protein beta-barrel domain-containing protein [Spirosoma fluviale]
MTKIYFRIVIVSLFLSCEVFGQEPTKRSFFAIRTGYVHSASNLIYSPDAMNYGTNVVGVADKSGFYGGAFYQHTVGKSFAYRVDLTYQEKGSTQNDQLGNYMYSLPYNYVGVTPLVGITPVTGLGIFVGPEANLRVNSIPTGSGTLTVSPTAIELGISSRLSYRYKAIGVEVSYFKGLNQYYTFNLGGPVKVDFKNQNWQAGIFIILFQSKQNK